MSCIRGSEILVSDQKPNYLINETSSYLLQHAYNPVEWFTWDKGLKKAKEVNKPILISIGYAACHWCHVMQHESFEDPETAELMNELFVSIKIDREERPDLDNTLQTAVARLSGGRGGWPLTAFATSSGQVFAGGTYFPKESSYGLPGFKQVLRFIIEEYEKDPEKIKSLTENNLSFLRESYNIKSIAGSTEKISTIRNITFGRLSETYDSVFGGFGFQPKFPNVSDLRLLLAESHRTKNQTFLDMVITTLNHLAGGGIYDQLGFGFHRYSTDRKWLIPHFEKMLYDNAQLLLLYLETFQLTQNKPYADISKEIITYLRHEMQSSDELFFSSQDADSEGREGAFFVWKEKEILDILGEKDGTIFNRCFGVTSEGNFENGYSVLHEREDIQHVLTHGEITWEKISQLKQKLFLHREKRVKPVLNDNIILSWNAITILAFARASFILSDPEYLDVAEQSLNSLVTLLQDQATGRLRRTFRKQPRGWAFSEDYTLLIQAILELFGLTGKRKYLELSLQFQRILDDHFWDETNSGYYFTGSWVKDTIVREKPVITFSIPNSNAVALENLLKLYHYTGESDFLKRADAQVAFLLGWFEEYETFNGEALLSLNLYEHKPVECIYFGGSDLSETDKIMDYYRSTFLPNSIFLNVSKETFNDLKDLPLVRDRFKESLEYPLGKATTFICKDLTCSVPLKTGTEIDLYLNSDLGDK
ncbi:thioredoxin [Candidatus Heimdallarchaeota archaeon B3_Heim]|nr:MAG: thioredoxin [Candidatus Heimdallarchaeota archaeon B3_Heim]